MIKRFSNTVGLWLIVILCLMYLSTAAVMAAPRLESLSDYVDSGVDGNEYVNVYRVPGGFYCAAGTITGLVTSIPRLMVGRQAGETLVDTYNRLSAEIMILPLTPVQQVLCNSITAANTENWTVKPNRTYTTRPVKRIVIINAVETVNTKDEIGRIAIGEPCGAEILSNTKTMWREVTITYPDGPVRGASVCTDQ